MASKPFIIYLQESGIPYRLLTDTECNIYKNAVLLMRGKGWEQAKAYIKEEDSEPFLRNYFSAIGTRLMLFFASCAPFGVLLENAADYNRIQEESPVINWMLTNPSISFLFVHDRLEECVYLPDCITFPPPPADDIHAALYKADFLCDLKRSAAQHELTIVEASCELLPDIQVLSLRQFSIRFVFAGVMEQILKFAASLKDITHCQAATGLALTFQPETGRHQGETSVYRLFLTEEPGA